MGRKLEFNTDCHKDDITGRNKRLDWTMNALNWAVRIVR